MKKLLLALTLLASECFAIQSRQAINSLGDIPGSGTILSNPVTSQILLNASGNDLGTGTQADITISTDVKLSNANGSVISSYTASNGNLDLFGTIANDDIQSSSITKQSNTFNAANRLLKLDGSGFVPNANLDKATLLNSSTQAVLNQGAAEQSNSAFYVSSGSVEGQALFARSSGNVGIGTASPTSKLHIVSGDIKVNDNAFLLWGDGTAAIRGNGATEVVNLWTSSNEQITINANGNVGIGSTSPVTKLDIAGQMAPFSRTTAQLLVLTPDKQGAVVYNSDVNSICHSSGTGVGAWVLTQSTGTVCR